MCDRCLPSEKYRVRSIVRSNCDGFNCHITFGRQFRRRRERQIPANLWICRRNFGEAVPRSAQKEQLASSPEPCSTNSRWISHCRDMDGSKVCFSPFLCFQYIRGGVRLTCAVNMKIISTFSLIIGQQLRKPNKRALLLSVNRSESLGNCDLFSNKVKISVSSPRRAPPPVLEISFWLAPTLW